jgi:signal peptidase II
MRRPVWFFFFVLGGVALDLFTKSLVFARLGRGGVRVLVPGILHLTTQENQGVAFSLLRERPALIFCLTLAALAFILWLYARTWRSAPALLLAALGLLLIGATGNLADRLCFGRVRDFIDFLPPLPLIGHWPVFNLADMCITAGVALYLLSELLPSARSRRDGIEKNRTPKPPGAT